MSGEADLQSEILNALLPGRKTQPTSRPLDVLDHPEAIVLRLESIAAGCQWMLDRWTELRGILEQHQNWPTAEKLKAIRLLGHPPLDMSPSEWEKHRERRFVNPDPDLDAYYDRMLDRQLDDRLPENRSATIAMLRSVADRAIARLETLAAGHRERAEADAVQRSAILSFDASSEGERLRRYQFSCSRTLYRSLDALLAVRRSGLGTPSEDPSEPCSESPVPCHVDSRDDRGNPQAEHPTDSFLDQANVRNEPIGSRVDDGDPQDDPTASPIENGNPQNEPTPPPVDLTDRHAELAAPPIGEIVRQRLPFLRASSPRRRFSFSSALRSESVAIHKTNPRTREPITGIGKSKPPCRRIGRPWPNPWPSASLLPHQGGRSGDTIGRRTVFSGWIGWMVRKDGRLAQARIMLGWDKPREPPCATWPVIG